MRGPVVVFHGGFAQDQRRDASPDFDDQPRLIITDHAVSDYGVDATKGTFLGIKVTQFTGWPSRKLFILVPKFWEMVPQ